MTNIRFILLFLALAVTGWSQAWQTVRSFRGTGVPAANMCNTGADLGIIYTDRNPNGLTYVCRLNGAGAFTWYIDTPAGGSQPLNANLTTLSATGNVPTATALLVNPAACIANRWVMDIAADGTLTCTQPASTNLSDSGVIVRGGAALLNVGYPMVVSAAGQAGQTPILGSAVGGTGNGFTKFTGPTTAEKTFTLPDTSATVLTTNAPVTVLQGGTGATTLAGAGIVTGASALTEVDTVPRISAAGVLGLSKLKCPLGICTLYDDTAVTGDTVLQLRNGAVGAARIRFGTGGTYDAGFHRSAAGVTNVDDGTVSGYGGLTAGSLTTVALATPTITSVTPGTNNGITCTYSLTAYAGDGTSTAASSTSSTAIGATGCAGTVIAWPKDTAVTRYQLSRTVGGTTQGLITAMAAWLNNSTNCPAACSYTDTGSAASGATPTANTTGRVSGAALTLQSSGSPPTCAVGVRGTFWVTVGAAGAADVVSVCLKLTDDTYAWRSL